MQTFVPIASVRKSLAVLDNQRSQKQTVEAWQMYRALTGQTKGWVNHPAVKMWRGYERALAYYYNMALAESLRRGVQFKLKPISIAHGKVQMPSWWGLKKVHASHRDALLCKGWQRWVWFGDDRTWRHYEAVAREQDWPELQRYDAAQADWIQRGSPLLHCERSVNARNEPIKPVLVWSPVLEWFEHTYVWPVE